MMSLGSDLKSIISFLLNSAFFSLFCTSGSGSEGIPDPHPWKYYKNVLKLSRGYEKLPAGGVRVVDQALRERNQRYPR